MSTVVNNAASVAPPVGVYRRDTVAAQERLVLPDSVRKGWITCKAEGEDVFVLFGDSTVAAAVSGNSTLSSSEPAVSASGWRIPNGEERSWDLASMNDVTHLSHISATGGTTGGFCFYKSSGKGA